MYANDLGNNVRDNYMFKFNVGKSEVTADYFGYHAYYYAESISLFTKQGIRFQPYRNVYFWPYVFKSLPVIKSRSIITFLWSLFHNH